MGRKRIKMKTMKKSQRVQLTSQRAILRIPFSNVFVWTVANESKRQCGRKLMDAFSMTTKTNLQCEQGLNVKLPNCTCYGGNAVFDHKTVCCLCPGPFFFFFTPARISQFLTAATKMSCGFSIKNSFLLLSISRCSFFSVIRLSVDIKIQWTKKIGFVVFFCLSLKVRLAVRV